MMKKTAKQKQRFQQKLSHKEQTGGGTGYEREFLRNPETGPLITDDLYGEIDSLEFFTPSRLRYYRNRLIKAMRDYPEDMVKINAGLSSYVKSAVFKTRELALIIQSIRRAFENCLLANYQNQPAEIQQVISSGYFETYDWLKDFPFKETELISVPAISHYQEQADKITLSAIKGWWRHMIRKDREHASEYEQLMIYQGVNHPSYYHETQVRPDRLSAYTGLDKFPYFESEVLSSYTLSYDLANKFMSGTLYSKGQRRLMINGHPDMISGRIFSSWFVEPAFLNGQYEILCMPNKFVLLTNWEYSNDISSGLKLERREQRY